ncbi:hypothetical protein FOVG_07900 [Fusarium oxysporum f. sp. pisi HDV247]|uniref:Uncharacterized protein n=1 Tax=Fusarium oxysporum f. sp. pisi HDV247 TaxID=1080344 RepID=W9PKN4_FUSOX|nr:hypothetical protein FOVG_07900 [Fusarium oxysporum f. sp. pisi HDV247]
MDPLPFLFSPSIEIISYWSQELVCCNLLQASQPFTTFSYHHYMHLNSDPINGQSVTGLQVNYEYSVISSTRTNCGFSSITRNRLVRPPSSTSKHRLISSKKCRNPHESFRLYRHHHASWRALMPAASTLVTSSRCEIKLRRHSLDTAGFNLFDVYNPGPASPPKFNPTTPTIPHTFSSALDLQSFYVCAV